MNLKITTPITTEPVTLIEAKAHLRLSSASFATGVISTNSIKPGSQGVAAAYSLVGDYVDVLGYETMAVLIAGVFGAGGTVDVKLQESNDHTTFTDVVGGAFAQVTVALDELTYNLAYSGKMRYIRAVATVAVAACNFSVSIVKDANVNVEDTLISNLITVARETAENITNRALATQTLTLTLDEFPTGNIRLPRPPLISVSGVVYTNSAGTPTTWAASNYIVETSKEPGEIVRAYGIEYPLFTELPTGAVVITYIAGYNTTTNICPLSIKQAMLLLISDLYELRTEFIVGQTIAKVSRSVDSLLANYRIWT